MAPNFDFIKKAHWRVIFYQIDDRLRIWAYGKKNVIQIPSHGEQGFITITEKYGLNKKFHAGKLGRCTLDSQFHI